MCGFFCFFFLDTCTLPGSSYGHAWPPWHTDTMVQEGTAQTPQTSTFPIICIICMRAELGQCHAAPLCSAGCPRAGSLPCPHAAGTRGQALPGGKARSTAPGEGQSQGSSRARSQPRSRAGSFLLCCMSRQPQELPWHRPGARPPHLPPVRSCASKAAPVRAPQPQELVWEEGARREIPHPKCRIWLASVQPSATTQSLRAGPPWGHTSTTPEAHCGLCNGYHGDPVPRDARPASNHGPALSQSPSEFALPTLPHAFQATNPKGELISKPPATAQPPPSSHHLCPHQQCAQTPQK